METLELVNIEEELSLQEHVHAVAYCIQHEGLRPENGVIIQGLCGALFRMNWDRREDSEKCAKCIDLFDIPLSGHCWVCGERA